MNAPRDAEPTAVDLFCGAGGLTAALEAAGFRTVVAADHDRDSIDTLSETKGLRLPIYGSGRSYLEDAKLLRADVREIRARDLRPSDVDADWRPDLLAGGPPCQPFSSAGRQ